MNRSLSKVSIVHRVADDDRQFPVRLSQRDGDVFAGNRLGHEFNHRWGDRNFAEVHVIQAVLLGHRPHHFLARGISQPDQGVGQIHPLLGDHLLGFSQLVGANDALVDENFRVIAFAFGGHVISGKVGADPYIYPG